MSEADIAEARGLLWAVRHGYDVRYLSHVTGYGVEMVKRLIEIGKRLEAHERESQAIH